MKTLLRIPLKQNVRLTVEDGDIVEKGSTLASYLNEDRDIAIEIAKILKVRARDVFRNLKKKPGDILFKNEILAEKKSFLSTVSVKSPIKGRVKEVDLTKGTVLIAPLDPKNLKLSSPVDCRIKSIGKDFIEIEIKAYKIDGIEGGGDEVTGELLNIHKTFKSEFEIGSDVEKRIVLISDARSDTMAKLDTLGASGIIAEKTAKNYKFPYITVSARSFKELSEVVNKMVWLRPDFKEILVLES